MGTDVDTSETTAAKKSGNPARAAVAKKVAGKKPATFDRLKSKKAVQKRIYVHLDSETSDEFDEVDGRLDAMIQDHRDRRIQAASKPHIDSQGLEGFLEDEMSVMEREWNTANEALQKTTASVLLRSPGRKVYERLLEENPGTDEQNEKHNKDHGSDAPYNAETFGAALISACAVEPEMTEAQAQELIDDWNLNEAMILFAGALEVCSISQVSHLGKGFGRTIGSTKN